MPTRDEIVRAIAHDLNGGLNRMALHVELLDSATAASEAMAGAAVQRTRSLASLRLAVRELAEIVERRLLPFGRAKDDGTGARSTADDPGVARA